MKRVTFPTLLVLAGCVSSHGDVVTAQEAQRFPGWILGCSAGPFGADDCPAAQAGAVMAQMPIGALERDLQNADFETFALEEVIRRMGAAVQEKTVNGGCQSVAQAVQAGEIMRAKVPANPALTGDERDLFDHFVNIANNASDYVGRGC